MILTLNDFYSLVLHIEDIVVPSKRIGYKKENGIYIAKVPLGVPDFENKIKESFSNPEKTKDWPLVGNLLVSIAIRNAKK